MKLKYILYVCPLALTGCVGYNTALFMTKSNAGLDLDAKPPTAEINISRKEGVVEPSFEGGQTPPVMASFSTKVGHDKMDSFFLGVNQTFAGGDAAVTMAKLYDWEKAIKEDTDEEVSRNEKKFDSKLTLSEPPKANANKGWFGWRKKLFGLAEPGEVRPFFFGTDTQFGMKVAWNGVGGPYPDTIKLGFNRKEIAVAPITINEAHEVRIPSFLATVDGGGKGAITGATNTLGVKQDVNWIQYFATGKSANYLARQYGVRRAMLERADPKATAIATTNIAIKQQRDAAYSAEEHQHRVDAILDTIEKLQGTNAIALATNPPVKIEGEFKAITDLRDPSNKRATDPKAAQQMLKIWAVLGNRTDKALDAWEAVLKAIQ